MKQLTNYKNRHEAFTEAAVANETSYECEEITRDEYEDRRFETRKQLYKGIREDFMQEYNARINEEEAMAYSRATGVIAWLRDNNEEITADAIFNKMVEGTKYDEYEVKAKRVAFNTIAKILGW